MNLQIAATPEGALVAVGPVPMHGARHDAYAYTASGLADILADHPTLADLGYVGVDGIDTVRTNDSPAPTSTPTRASSTPRSARPAPPSNTPSHTSRHGACSAKKAVATEHHWKSTRACSRQLSAYSSSRLMNKPPVSSFHCTPIARDNRDARDRISRSGASGTPVSAH